MFISGLPHAFTIKEQRRIEDVFQNYQPKTGYLSNDTLVAGITNSDPAEAWVQQELEHYESHYTEVQDLHVCVTTFNVGKKRPTGPFPHLCALHAACNPKQQTDMIVLTFQEIDMGATALFREETDAATPWVAAAQAAIGADRNISSTSPYYAFPHKQLVGLLLCVFVRRELLKHVREFKLATVATGALGSIGNKGAVGAHLVIHRTCFCIITVHLASGVDMVRKRNDDINTILKDMNFNAGQRVGSRSAAGEDPNVAVLLPELLPRDHDIILIAGDFNYRVNLTYEEAVELASRGEVAKLLKYDQLIHEMENPHSPWAGFRDLKPNYLPTYRFNIGTSTYDTSGKRRVPSFTDRVSIWTKREAMQELVKVDHLRALGEVLISDHKPVQAQLRLPVWVEVPHKKSQVTQQLRENVRTLGLDRASSAHISINTSVLDFGTHKPNQCEVCLSFTVTNTGPCTAVVRILRQCITDAWDGTWLRVTPLDFVVVPGESQEVEVMVQIHPGSTPWLSRWMPFSGQNKLEVSSILMICVRNGPLACVECKTVFEPSILGNSLTNLMLMGPEPCANAYTYSEDLREVAFVQKLHVPKELWHLVSIIVMHPCVPGLFMKPPRLEKCKQMIDELDSAGTLLQNTLDAHSAAECLLKLLHNLQEPVIPFEHYEAALRAGELGAKAPIIFISTLPTIHANVFIFIMGMLNFLLRPVNARSNGLTIELLAQIFGNVLIVRPPISQGRTHERLRQGGGVDQHVRRQIQREKKAAHSLLEFFLSSPPTLLQY